MIFCLLFLCFFPFFMQAQVVDKTIISNEYIVMFSKTASENEFPLKQSTFNFFEIKKNKKLSPYSNIYLLTFDEFAPDLLNELKRHPEIIVAQHNHRVHRRSGNIPNDPVFTQQWNHEIIQACDAWDLTTGGLSTEGDTIVVAVIDTGCDVLHEDLEQNIWKNHKEIPNDGIDNDGNGYVDDFLGWNFDTENDDHPIDVHGTEVVGIIGAKGNNGVGVSGVNWTIKTMVLSNAMTEDEIVSAYLYAYNMRKRYNETGGSEGAFVVATNASFGINNARPDDFPIWCAVYDTLGQEGVLSVAATTNMDVNVEVIGDIPARCTSPYLITVTNTDENDQKELQSGWGKVSVDLGAPGSSAYTTKPANSYGTAGGTSSSAPHVTGAIGLLYSVPNSIFMSKVKAAPEEMALTVKYAILQGVEPNADLLNRTTTGGRLNLYNSLKLLTLNNPTETVKINNLFPNPVIEEATLFFETNENELELSIFNVLGQLKHTETLNTEGLNYHFLNMDSLKLKNGWYLIELRSGKSKARISFLVH